MRTLYIFLLTFFITILPTYAQLFGGQIKTKKNLASQYPAGSVFCNGPTAIVDVINPATGKIWMDRNLGASQVATSSFDANAYGDLYQWGRGSDGHQCRNSATTSTLSSTDQPGNGIFILNGGSTTTPPYGDWRNPQNTSLWQGINGTNNPCPTGYRLPTLTELSAEKNSFSSPNATGAFASPIKLTRAGSRYPVDGSKIGVGSSGSYWSSTISSNISNSLYIDNNLAVTDNNGRASGISVRCIKN